MKASPFEEIRWSADQPEVKVEEVWYRPLAIDGLDVERILELCDQRWPGQRVKRFSEDLVEAMVLLDVRPGGEVTLVLARVEDGEEVILEGVANTNANRNRLRDGERGESRRATLSAQEAREDLEAFGFGLRERFAYHALKGIEWDAELERLGRELDEPVSTPVLGAALNQLLLRAGDGHASVSARGYRPGNQGPFLPFLMADAEGGIVAFSPNRDALLDPEHPFVVSLGGYALEECLGAVRDEVVDGSPQLVRQRSLHLLREVALWYPRLAGKDASLPERLSVELAGEGAKLSELTVSLADKKPLYGPWPRTQSRLIEDAIGYLRLASMDADAVREVHAWMPAFRETQGLIVDVRGNGGGSREALLALAGYLVDPERGPWVGNIAAYRTAEGFDDDHLEARFMYRADAERFGAAQRAAIQAAAEAFVPEWEHPDGFSAWHYLVLDRTGAAGEYRYGRPVVILADAGCFSATDIFLGALELHPGVTLLGAASGGGSARSQRFELPHSRIRVSCASMASFRPDGRLYDGRGIEVDVEVRPDPSYFLQDGKDAALEAALEFLRRQ